MSIRVLVHEHPHRTLALVTESHVLFFKHTHSAKDISGIGGQARSPSNIPLPSGGRKGDPPRCLVEFSRKSPVDLKGYRTLNTAKGTLGLITLNGDVFICVVTGSAEVATVRPGENVMRISAVEFYCLNRSDYDQPIGYSANYRDGPNQPNPYPNQTFSSDDQDYGGGFDQSDTTAEHPFNALKKLLNGGTFYYSFDFDLTRRLQDRIEADSAVDISSLDQGLLWNSYMINPLLSFRNRLTQEERDALDHSAILTSVIRGFAGTMTIPPGSSPIRSVTSHHSATLTVISRLSSRRAGTRFNSRGVDDDGNVANFVETETVLWSPTGVCFAYVQVRGSIPIFWESSSSLVPGQQKLQITRSPEATQLSFDRHFDALERTYGAVHIVNLLSASKPAEVELTERYRYHVSKSPLRRREDDQDGEEESVNHDLLRETEFDFHERTRQAGGYEGVRAIRQYLNSSAEGFVYFITDELDEDLPETDEIGRGAVRPLQDRHHRIVVVMQQAGVFRVNCLDCLDRTNLVQGIISQMALELFLEHRGEVAGSSNLSVFWLRHSSLWADNGDALSKIYAGTGALKSSFTRHGKMSLGGLMADARKSATRLYVNHFDDKGRQNTVDLLLGRLVGQEEIELVDPVNDWVNDQLRRRTESFESHEKVRVWVGTYNLNGKMMKGDVSQLSLWLDVRKNEGFGIVVIGFQEIVELSPQQIMSTDPGRRIIWEKAVKECLNHRKGEKLADSDSNRDDYILLRTGQLVGAALMVFVKTKLLHRIKNVEGAIKKTGMSGMAGNKGAVSIRMDLEGTSICFVTAHLAAGFGNWDERNRDYSTIVSGLRFQRDRKIEDHEVVIWAGDFNYRVGLKYEKAKSYVDTIRQTDNMVEAEQAMDDLYKNDQLNIQMMMGNSFPFYTEGRIKFLPTYKFDLGRDDYDTSEKARIPAWTDRVLWKVTNHARTKVRQVEYDSVMGLRFSDHRPVYASFEIDVRVINEDKKGRLLKELYEMRTQDIKDGLADEDGDSSASEEAEDLMGYQSVADGLPPASSDRRKWWMDGDKPVSSQVKPPSSGMVLNDQRSGNPWRTDADDDWVQIGKKSAISTAKNGSKAKPELPPPRRQGQTSSLVARDSIQTPTRMMPPPWEGERLGHDGARSNELRTQTPPISVLYRTASISSTASQSSVNRKLPPPKPTKPSALVSNPAHVSSAQPSPLSSSSLPRMESVSTQSDFEQPPPLPKRTGTNTSLARGVIEPVARKSMTSSSNQPRTATHPQSGDQWQTQRSGEGSMSSVTALRPGADARPPALPRRVGTATKITDLMSDDTMENDSTAQWRALTPTK